MIKAIVYDCFGVLGNYSAAGWHRNEAVIGSIPGLKGSYKIGLLSSLSASSVKVLFPDEERARLFDVVVTGGEVGLSKDRPDIYRVTCERLGVAPEEAVFIDNTDDNNRVAATIGMHTILFRDATTCRRELEALLQSAK
jgi:FMN phosphatase YigB (HAD superfamily)